MALILGLDPGTRITGYALIDSRDHRVSVKEVGVVKPDGRQELRERIRRIYDALQELVDQHRPDVIVLEKLYAHYKHPATAPIIGHVRGVICLLSAQKSIDLVEYSVKRVRQSVTGNGNATKEQTREFVAARLEIDARKLTLDASDALALALGYVNMSAVSCKP